jgi:hypothetical protein
MAYGTLNVDSITTSTGQILGAGNSTAFKNRIINGGMTIDQRNAGASVIPANATYTLDRWEYFGSQASKVTIQQLSASPPNGYANYLGMTVSTAVTSIGATDYFEILQKIEANNVTDFAWGTSSGQSISVSFWAKCSNTGSFSASLQSSVSPYTSYPFLFTITSAGTWQYITVNIPAPPSGTNWATGVSTGIALSINLAVGSTYSGTANAWTNTNSFGTTGASSLMGTVGNYLYLTGVQLEVGTQATSFDFRDYGCEYNMCLRYHNNFGGTDASPGQFNDFPAWMYTSTVVMSGNILPVPMRATPTVTVVAATVYYNGGGLTQSGALTGTGISNQLIRYRVGLTNGTGGGAATMYAQLYCDAEL